ncbi:MAG: DUF2069 domain-containing protein [Pseudomonadales bacterium]|nr:DUF2069 domain-containing protein [Pseudomonadales bacterium]
MVRTTREKLQTYEKLFFGFLFALVAYGFLSDFLTVSGEQLKASFIVTGVKWLPVVLLTPLLARGNANSYVWLAYLLIPYFCWAVLKGFAPSLAGLLGAGEAVFTALLFTFSVICARWKKAS